MVAGPPNHDDLIEDVLDESASEPDLGHGDSALASLDARLFGDRSRRFPLVQPIVTLAIFVACIAVAALMFRQVGSSPSPSELASFGGVSRAALDNGEWWKFVAAGFVHSSLLHLLLNMLFLLAVGAPFERVTGHGFTISVLVAGSIAGAAGSVLTHPDSVGSGASAMAYALLGATVTLDPRARTGLGTIARWMLVANVALGAVLDQLSVGAHIGGLLAGIALGLWAHATGDGTRSWAFRVTGSALVLAAATAMATFPPIAARLGIQGTIDRPVSAPLLERRIGEQVTANRPYEAVLESATCTMLRDDGSTWACEVGVSVPGTSGRVVRPERWIARVSRDGAMSAAPFPESADQAGWALLDWSYGDDGHDLREAACTPRGAAPGGGTRWGCEVDGTREGELLMEWWAVTFQPTGSWTRDAILPTAAGLEETIQREGLVGSDGSRTGVAAVTCRQVDRRRQRWECAVQPDGGGGAIERLVVAARTDGSWQLRGAAQASPSRDR